MPKQLTDCVKHVKSQGHDESSAYAICSKSTGWRRKSKGKWKNKKTGASFHESVTPKFDEFIQEHAPVKQSPIGLIGYATEDGIAFIKAFDDSENHQLLIRKKRPIFGINSNTVVNNIAKATDFGDGISTQDIAGWRYSYKSQTLYFWFNDQTDSMLKDYIKDFIENKLHLQVNKIKPISSTQNYRQAHTFESVDRFREAIK